MGGPMTLPARLDRDYPRNHHILSGSSHPTVPSQFNLRLLAYVGGAEMTQVIRSLFWVLSSTPPLSAASDTI
jgi:hypothetical protein